MAPKTERLQFITLHKDMVTTMKNKILSKTPHALATVLFSLLASTQANALTAQPDRLNTSAGQAKTVDVLWNDTGSHFWVSNVNNYSARGGRAYVVGGRKIHYTPKPGFTGTDEFWYEIADSHGKTNSSKVTVYVSGGGHKQVHHKRPHTKPNYSIEWSKPGFSVSYSKPGGLEAQFNQAQGHHVKPRSNGHKHRGGGANPVGRADAFTTYSGSGQVALYVLANDQGSGLSVSQTNPWTARGGQAWVVNDYNGSYIAYTPKPGFRGLDELWYVLRDQHGRTNSTKVSISVH